MADNGRDPGPSSGRAERLVPLGPAVLAGARRLAHDLSGSLESVILAVHAVVQSVLTGEGEVSVGYWPPGAASPGPLPYRLVVGDGSWRSLVEQAHRAQLDLVRPADGSDGARPPGTVVDLGTADALGGGWPGTVDYAVALDLPAERLRLTYRTDRMDAARAARIAGYHQAALRHAVADPSAPHRRCSLLSEHELTYQLSGVGYRHRDLPDLRVHELFEQQARCRPDAVAAVLGTDAQTYAQLNRRANRIAHALLRRGLAGGQVVAVVTERNLDWLASVLAVFKAGGVYLPIEPHFPAQRMATMLRRADCRLVLTERGSRQNLDRAAGTDPPMETLDLDPDGSSGLDGLNGLGGFGGAEMDTTDPGVPVGADQPAYVFFTSGSTGEPKGAVCGHLGLVNHLYAKIDDLRIGPGQTVAQTAPQCFDISLWQLVAGLVVGARTLIVPQEVVLDARRFVDTLVAGRVELVQVVPSYLEMLLSHLEEEPRELPDLRFVSATGEPLKKELLARWFGAYPGIRVLNAYGLTETSDDTNHEILDRVPAGTQVPLGAPVANVVVSVVDDELRPVPLGAPGEIAFSGICVGLGYLNDPDRTRAAFLDDPLRPGLRLYRSGDVGRWGPDGRLEFLGRRDAQVKIRGFRIEIGEVENQLLRVPGVRDAAVVIEEAPGGRQHLVAFYSAAGELPAATVIDALATTLPEYMVPTSAHQLPALPLTGNGKIDKKVLARRAIELRQADAICAEPETPTERRLAGLWAQVLGVPVDAIGRADDFFALGGTSLSAVRLVAGLDRVVTLAELADRPVLADLAELVDGRDAAGTTAVEQPAGRFPVPRSPSAPAGRRAATRPGGPVVVDVPTRLRPGAEAEWAAERRDELHAVVAEHGAVLVRGLRVGTVEDVRLISRELVGDPVVEREGFASRRCHGPGLYSSAEWPSADPMCMHHELSYTLAVPRLMLFGCLSAPRQGGATALADGAAVLRALPDGLVDRFDREGWQLVRAYNGDVGMRWQAAFGSDDSAVAESYCRDNGIEFAWYDGSELVTWQRRTAVVPHPDTGRRSWFNQIAFLNEWTMAAEVREFLVQVFGIDRLPFNTRFGGGDPIGPEVISTIQQCYDARTVSEPWRDGDVLLVDNIRMAHSREAYEGSRAVVVAMGSPVTLPGHRLPMPG